VHYGGYEDLSKHGVCEHASYGEPFAVLGGSCTAVEARWRIIQHTLFSCVATFHHLSPYDLWHDIRQVLPSGSPALAALDRAERCALQDADAVARHCLPWLLDPVQFLAGGGAGTDAWSLKRQVCRLAAAYVVGAGAVCGRTQLNGGSVCCGRLLHALHLPIHAHGRKLQLCQLRCTMARSLHLVSAYNDA